MRDYVYWFNKGAKQRTRNIQAVRYGKWRLYRSLDEDPWRLYDLDQDPREENNIAQQFPEVVQQLEAKHTEWAVELPPIYDLANRPPRPKVIPNQDLSPQGRWITTDGIHIGAPADLETVARLKAQRKLRSKRRRVVRALIKRPDQTVSMLRTFTATKQQLCVILFFLSGIAWGTRFRMCFQIT